MLENLNQFGSLKAMGVTNGTIVGMVLLQGTVIGAIGYCLGVGLASLFGVLTAEHAGVVLHALAGAGADGRVGGRDRVPGQPDQRPQGAGIWSRPWFFRGRD